MTAPDDVPVVPTPASGPCIWVRGQFEFYVDSDACNDDEHAAMDLVRERVEALGGRVLLREEVAS